PAPPTPTNTRVPTPFPTQPKLPTPTVVFSGFPTAIAPPTATLRPLPPPPNATATPTFAPPPVVDRQYSVSFRAQANDLFKGDCTRLEWDVVGSTQVRLQGQDVEPSGSEKVCPERTTDYTLEVQMPDSTQIDRKKVKIRVQ
ncbi:MAG: hypothetical protein D6768_05520, partial [Chloroflexi bacterium]